MKECSQCEGRKWFIELEQRRLICVECGNIDYI